MRKLSRIRLRTPVILLFSFLFSHIAICQRTSPTGQVSIAPVKGKAFSGIVVNAATGDPLQRVRVTLHAVGPSTGSAYSAVTDGGGRFSFAQLPPGKYEFDATKKGFLPRRYNSGQTKIADIPLDLTDNGTHQALIRLVPTSVIVGHVFDTDGEPITDAVVQATPVGSSVEGRKITGAVTNDLGEYRLYGLIPGEYYVSAARGGAIVTMPRRASSPLDYGNYIRTFYPRSADSTSAQVLILRAGDQAADIDIQLIRTTPKVVKVVNLAEGSPESPKAIPNVSNPSATDSTVLDRQKPTSVSGRVSNAANGLPVGHAQVMLLDVRKGSGIPYVTETANTGAFRFANLEAGDYRLAVLREGFLPSSAGTGEGRLLQLQSGAEVRNLIVRMSPCSVIAGTVFDDNGEPASDIRIEAMRLVYSDGKRQMRTQATTSTDDLGRYRLHGLEPGNYYVKASAIQSAKPSTPNAKNSIEYLESYYPRAVDVGSAALINVRPGDQVGGIDIWTENRPATRVAGKVLSSDGGPVPPDTVISLTPLDQSGTVSLKTANVKDSEGHFQIHDVLPGSYTIFIMSRRGASEFAGFQSVQILSTEITNLQIGMSAVVNTTGSIRIAGNNSFNLEGLRVFLQPETGFPTGSIVANLHADGTFVLRNVLPERYSLKVFGLPKTFYISGLEVGSQAVEDRILDFTRGVAPVQITVAGEGGVLTGSVFRYQEQPVSGAKVVLVPSGTNAAHDLYKVAVSTRDGTFRIVGIAPGEYTLFAWEHVEGDAFFDPDFLAKSQDFGRRVVMRENSSENLNIPAMPFE